MYSKSTKRSYGLEKKVAVIIEEHRIGGPAHRIARVYDAWPAGECEIVAIIPRFESEPLAKLFKGVGLPVARVPLSVLSLRPYLLMRYLLLFPFELISLVFFLRSQHFDLIHVAGGAWMFKSLWAAKLAGVPVLLHLNDTNMPKPIRTILSASRNIPNGIIFASEASKIYYREYVRDVPMFVIPSCIDRKMLGPERPVSRERDRHGSRELIIGSVGNVSPVKGHDRLISATSILVDAGILVRVRIAGAIDGTYEAHFKMLAELAERSHLSGNIEWLGSISDVAEFLDSLDVFVCCSRNESSPMAVWEAMSRGVPVVCFDVGDAAMHITNANAGYVVSEQSSEALARCLLESEGTLSGFNAVEISNYAEKAFSAESVAEKTIAAYRELLHV